MALLDSILSLTNASGVVTRHAVGSFDSDGVWQAGTSSTFTVTGAIQPATGMQRVVGGRDMISDEQGQHVTDVRVFYTESELRARTPTTEPDTVTFSAGTIAGTWTVHRVEEWALNEQVWYRVSLTRQTQGAS